MPSFTTHAGVAAQLKENTGGTREKYDGTGIGLAITKKIIHHHPAAEAACGGSARGTQWRNGQLAHPFKPTTMAKKDGTPGDSTVENTDKKMPDEQAGGQPPAPPAAGETEVKNAHASGMGSMGRTDGGALPDERD